MASFRIQVFHPGLNRFRVVSGPTYAEAEAKAEAQKEAWDELWVKKQEAETRRARYLNAAKEKEQKQQVAQKLTVEAEEAIKEAEEILVAALRRNPPSIQDLKRDTKSFALLRPVPPRAPTFPEKPSQELIPQKPDPQSPHYNPKNDSIDLLWPPRRKDKLDKALRKYEDDLDSWRNAVRAYNDLAEKHNANVRAIHQRYIDEVAEYKAKVAAWEEEKAAFLRRQVAQNEHAEKQRKAYSNGEPDAVCDFCEATLLHSEYPSFCPSVFDCGYTSDTKTLVVEYELPRIEDIPSTKSVKYNKTQDQMIHTSISESALNKLYEDINYKICLRTIHELFASDSAQAMDSIVFNGYVDTIDKATGHKIRPCILTLHVSKSEFQRINLAEVDPKACFRKLKGVSASKLQALAPVAPLVTISREDKRFVEAYGVAEDLSDSSNLASMDWEDFEHLIRELFEKEFAVAGGEVKVTQASRDGGVDAIAIDLDPIRGGKIVIQAKRYTNVVGVSAVRDLWGTVNHEGAMKGILVTTSYYGPDAHEFAKGKPISLLDGSNLLHLLEKHGHRARIDLREAKIETSSRGKA